MDQGETQKNKDDNKIEIIKLNFYKPLFSCLKKEAVINHNLPTHVCCNFSFLIVKYPDLAKKVMDKCISDDEYYDFSVLEGEVLPEDEDRRSKASHLKNNSSVWQMVRHKKLELLKHPLVTEWFNYKWSSHICWMFYGSFLFKLARVILLIVFLDFETNLIFKCMEKDREDCYRSTRDRSSIRVIYEDSELDCFAPGIEVKPINEQPREDTISYISYASMIITIVHLLLYEFIYKGNKLSCLDYRSSISFAGMIIWNIMTIIAVMPVYQEWQWIFGILFYFASMMHLIHELNKIPYFTSFFPITREFVFAIIKILVYIIAIIFTFAFAFHLILFENNRFSHLPKSMIKTTLWLFTDFDYNDSFTDPEPKFSVLANTIFLIFITTFVTFIANLCVSSYSTILQEYQNDAEIAKYQNCINMVIIYDCTYPLKKKKYKNQNNKNKFNLLRLFMNNKVKKFNLLRLFNNNNKRRNGREKPDGDATFQDLSEALREVNSLKDNLNEVINKTICEFDDKNANSGNKAILNQILDTMNEMKANIKELKENK